MKSSNSPLAEVPRSTDGHNFHIAFLWSAIFTLWAAMRPLDLGHDTHMYSDFIRQYMIDEGNKFPDLVFDSIASAISHVFSQFQGGADIGGRFFLAFISAIEGVLLFLILRTKRSAIEASLLAMSFGPLMFLDLIRQGLSMLFAGAYFACNRRGGVLMLVSVATHVVAVVSILLVPLKKGSLKIVLLSLSTLLLIYLLVADRLLGRFEFYGRLRYFFSLDEFQSLTEPYSYLNFVVMLFMLYGALIGGFKKTEAAILLMFYVVGIYFPLFHRLYFFYFFCMACSREMLLKGNSTKNAIFNVCYAAVSLRFSLGAFLTE